MNPQDTAARQVWDHTLISLRQEKRRRRVRLSILTPIAVVLLTLLFFRPHPSPEASPAIAITPPSPGTEIAVMVMRDGLTTLENIPAGDLGDIELNFSLNPVLADFRTSPEDEF